MKKLLALTLALLMALTGVSAFADTVYTKLTVDSEAAKTLMTGFGMSEDQAATLDPILALVNALGVKVTTVADGAQIDLDLNGTDALSLGYALDDAGVTAVSTLFPNYAVTISQETLGKIVEQFMANMPGAGNGGEGGMDMTAMMETFGGYYQRWMEACAAAGKPGDPVPGEYEFEGFRFDTLVPVTVDVPAIAQATQSLMDELMNDPAAMAAIRGMAQGMAQNSGEAFDEANFEADFKAGFEEWLAHFPDTVTAEYYVNGGEDMPFYLRGDSMWGDEGAFSYTMLFVDGSNMDMSFTTSGEEAIQCGFTMHSDGMTMSFSMNGMYMGLVLSFLENQFAADLYFMDVNKPLIGLTVTTAQGGERTLPVDAAGKTTVPFSLPMNGDDEAVQGLMGDIMINGLGALMGVLGEQVPELAGMLMGGAAMAG